MEKGLARCRTQLSWIQPCARPKHLRTWLRAMLKHLWVQQDAKLNFLGLGCMLDPNACGSDKVPNQLSWARLRAKTKLLWVWQNVKPNSLELDYTLNPCAFKPRWMLDSIFLGIGLSWTLTYNRITQGYHLLTPQLCKNPLRIGYVSINININYKG